MLAVLLAGWVGLRAALWQSPFEEAQESDAQMLSPADKAVPDKQIESQPVEIFAGTPLASRWRAAKLLAVGSRLTVNAATTSPLPVSALLAQSASPRLSILPPAPPVQTVPLPGVPAGAPPLSFVAAPDNSRWSADLWLLVRQDGSGPLAAVQPSYGRSQVGAVMRYRLSDASRYRPQAYLRVSSALAGPREQELAAGLSARPLPRIPVRVAAEARVTRTANGTEVRPAVYAATELQPVELPLGVRAEAYVQAGYVGGLFATGFVDGQARAERRIASFGDNEVGAGAGIWGGAQAGAARLDVGPTATVRFRLGNARGRLTADYRFRVAGDAQPASGPALTLSAGF